MDTPDREHKSLPHALREVQATAVAPASWYIELLDDRAKSAPICPAGGSIAEAYTEADAYVAKTFPGFHL